MQAHLQAVNLSATALYFPGATSKSYLNYGAAASEVGLFLNPFQIKVGVLKCLLLISYHHTSHIIEPDYI